MHPYTPGITLEDSGAKPIRIWENVCAQNFMSRSGVRNTMQSSAGSISSIFRPARILVAEDEAVLRDLLVRKLTGLGYACESCENGDAALQLLSGKPFDLMLADIFMPETGGISLLKEVMRIRPHIAVILVASIVDIEIAVDALKYGAYDYITKPFSLEEMSISVSRALEKRRLIIENKNYQRTLEEQVTSRTYQLKEALATLEQTYHSTLAALSKALDSRDADSEGHSLRVTAYAARLAWQSGLNEAEIKVVEQGVLLHDIGKIGIPDELLRKRGKLNKTELTLMKRHPEIGFRILTQIEFLKGAAQLVLHHHERYDGKGYPLGLKGEEISIGARIFAVAESLEDRTSDRPSKLAMSFEDACLEIGKMSGVELDPGIVEFFQMVPAADWKIIHDAISASARNWLNAANQQIAWKASHLKEPYPDRIPSAG
jgi:putative two-component system response regulator